MSAIEQAAQALRDAHAADHYRTDALSPLQAAQALADAGLLKSDAEQKLLEDWAQSQVEGWDVVTPADRSVLDAADEWVYHMDAADDADSNTPHELCADIALAHLDEAVRARREAQL